MSRNCLGGAPSLLRKRPRRAGNNGNGHGDGDDDIDEDNNDYNDYTDGDGDDYDDYRNNAHDKAAADGVLADDPDGGGARLRNGVAPRGPLERAVASALTARVDHAAGSRSAIT